jgi:hypothetical protein
MRKITNKIKASLIILGITILMLFVSIFLIIMAPFLLLFYIMGTFVFTILGLINVWFKKDFADNCINIKVMGEKYDNK